MEFVEPDRKRNKQFIPTNRSLCYNSSPGDPINSTMEIFCDRLLTGNQIRVELSDKKAQLVLCDIRVYKGKHNITYVVYLGLQLFVYK